VLAVTLRIVATIAWSGDLLRDPDAYGGLAARLLEGHDFVAPDGHATAFRPPLYPVLLAAVLPGGTLGIAVLQIALGVATVALTVVIGSRIGFGRNALLAGLFVAIDPLLLRYTPQIMTEITCTFLASLLLWAGVIVQARVCDGAACRKRTGLAAFCLGVLFGLAVLSRPTFWAWGILIAPASIARSARDRSHMKSQLIASICACAGLVMTVAPWTVRNAAALGEPVVTTTHGGYTLLLANNPVYWKEVVLAPAPTTWSGGSLDAWQRSLEEQMAADGIAYDDELARDRWMKARAIEQIRHHPALFVRSGLYRVSRLWDVVPATPGSRPVRFAVGAFYVVTEALALAGLCWWVVGAWRADRSAAALTPAVLLIVAFTAVHFMYWSDARMRAPCVPAVALLAGFACSRIVERVRTQRSSTA
jgi:hypothetical protein